MKATVTKPFPGVKAGEVYPTQFAVGDTVDGRLARIAVDNGWAVGDEPATADDKPAEPGEIAQVAADEPAPKARARRGRKS